MLSSSWKLMSSENSGKSLTNVLSLPAGQEGHCHTEVKKQGKQDNLSGGSNNCSTYFLHFLRTNIFCLHLPVPRHFIHCETFQGSAHCPVHYPRTVPLKTTKSVYDSRCRILMTVQLWKGLLIPLVSVTWLVTNQSESGIQEVKYDLQQNKKGKTEPQNEKSLSFNSTSDVHSWTTKGRVKTSSEN